MNPPRYYRNYGNLTRYHATSDNWLNTGKALCGADISKPAYQWYPTNNIFPDKNHPLCKHCAKILKTKKSRSREDDIQ